MRTSIRGSIILLVLYVATFINVVRGEIILTEDRPYDPIDIQIPANVWERAMNPTPVLKSTATVVVPIHIQDEYLDSDEEDANEDEVIDEENEIETQTVASEVTNAPVVEEIVNQNLTTLGVMTNATVAPPQDEVVSTTPEVQQQVTGQGIRFPCSCVGGQCGCCTNMNVQWFKTNACGNISFVPEDFVFDVRLSVNNNTVIRRRVSASDPPPICFNPRRVPFIRICAEISNIRIRNRNAFACLDITADIAEFPIYTASFRCFGLGSSGVQTGLKPKPVSSGPAPVNLFGGGDSDGEDGGGFIENAASAVIGGTSNGDGLFGGQSGGLLFGGGDDDDGGPLDVIGDAVGEFFGRAIPTND